MRYAIIFLALLAPLSCGDETPAQAGLSLDQVVELFELGYGAAEVKKEIERAGVAFAIDAAAEKRLRAAGATDGLLAFMKKGKKTARTDGRVTAALDALDAGEPVERVLDRIAAAPPQTPTAADTERIAAAPLPVRLALAGRPLKVADLAALADGKASDATYTKLLALCGAAGEPLPAARALALRRAGVPRDVLRAFRTGTKRAPATAERTEAAGYEHVGRRFVMKTPADWVLLRDIDEGTVRYVFTPETGKRAIDEVEVALVLTLGAPPEGSVWSSQTPRALLERMLPWIRVIEPGMELDGAIGTTRMGSLAAASQEFRGTPRGRTGTFKTRMVVAERDGLVYNAVAIAKADEFAKWAPVFEGILAASTFGRLGHPERGEERDAAAFAEKCKPSVVSVKVRNEKYAGSGTGFVISRDGYVLTNWHVVWNQEENRPEDHISVAWDDSLARPEVKATLIGAHSKVSAESEAGGMLGGIDVALLKLPPGDYTPLRLSPTATVKLGDPVVNLGFPQSDRVAGLSLFVTRGVVVRFNRDVYGRTVGLAVDAKHAPGSSGGPCLDLRTGGVIGLTTWSYKIGSRTTTGESANDLVGYYFLSPTDAALAHFPLVADLGYAHDKRFDFLTTYELAGQFLALAAEEAALAMADRAVEMKPQSADALILRATCQQALAYKKLALGESAEVERLARLAEASLERAVIAAPKRPEPRIMLAGLFLELDRLDDAEKHAKKAVEDYPDRWDAHMVAARVAAERGKVEEGVRHLREAKRTSRDLVPDPYLLAGQLAYGRGWHEEGKQEYERALAIHPGSHDARLGVADFLLHKRRWADAIAAFEKVRGRFPRSPAPVHRIGYCYKEQRRFKEALRWYRDAEQEFKKAGLTPPEGFFIEQADVYKALDADGEIGSLTKHLLHRGRGPQSIPVHFRLAAIFRDNDINAIGTMHVRRAILWAKLEGKKLEPEGFKLVDPDIQHITWMAKEGLYPIPVVVDLVENCRLKYLFPEEKEARQKEYRKLRENGVPHEVIMAIIESNKRYAPAAAPVTAKKADGTTTGGKGSTEQPAADDDGKAARALIGSWRYRTVDQLVGEVDLTMTFTAAGQWTSRGVMGGFRVDDGGTYTAKGTTVTCIVRRSTNPVVRPGTTRTLSFQASGTTLKIYDQGTKNWMTFTRVK